MSASASDITTAGIGVAAGYPSLNVAAIPTNIQDGNGQAKQAYVEGLAFESVLVNQLSQQMANTMYGGQGSQGSGTDGATAGDSSSGGLLSGAGAYSSLIPQTLTTSIMDAGGLGMAEKFAQEMDPALVTDVTGASGAAGSLGPTSVKPVST